MKSTGQRHAASRPRRRRKKQQTMSLYRLVVIVILVIGSLFLSLKLYQLWKIHKDMVITVQQESTLTDENQKLQTQKDQLEDPDEVGRRAREQFGLVKSGEIPYKR